MDAIFRLWGQVITSKPDRRKIETAMGGGSTLDYEQIERILIDELVAHEELPAITPKYASLF
jgi:hypothetical protein